MPQPTRTLPEETKGLAWLLFNGMRTIRWRTTEAWHYQIDVAFTDIDVATFMNIMIIGISVCAVSTGVILYQIWVIDRNKKDILSLYSKLRMDQVKSVFEKCEEYLENLYQEGGMEYRKLPRKKMSNVYQEWEEPEYAGNSQQKGNRDYVESEEEKDERILQDFSKTMVKLLPDMSLNKGKSKTLVKKEQTLN